MDDQIALVDALLSRSQLLGPPCQESAEGKELYQEICKLVLGERLYLHIWSEPTLNELEQLFQTDRPDEETFGPELENIRNRTIEVRDINDFFFGVVDQDTTSQDLSRLLEKLQSLPDRWSNQLDKCNALQSIRNQEGVTSEKVARFLEFLKDDLGVDFTEKESIIQALASLKSREVVGKVTALQVIRWQNKQHVRSDL